MLVRVRWSMELDTSDAASGSVRMSPMDEGRRADLMGFAARASGK
jgi:hypothetical protein